MTCKSVINKPVKSGVRLTLIKRIATELVRRRTTEQEVGTRKLGAKQIKPTLGSGCQAQLNDCTKDSSCTEKQGTLQGYLQCEIER